MKRIAKAHWSGNLREGKGNLTTESGTLDKVNFSYKTRFEEGESGTNPEELLAAAHAGCFTMAVASLLTKQRLTPAYLNTEATLTMEDSNITRIHLSITGSVSGITGADFIAITKEAEKNCIISKALSIVITSEAHFVA